MILLHLTHNNKNIFMNIYFVILNLFAITKLKYIIIYFVLYFKGYKHKNNLFYLFLFPFFILGLIIKYSYKYFS